MENEKLNILIANPGLLNNETVIELKLLAKKYPWFQLGWMLYLRNLKEIESPDYQPILKKVAVLVSDRKLLYSYLNSESQKKESKIESGKSLPDFDYINVTDNGETNSLIDKFLLSNPGAIRRNPGDEDSSESEKRIDIAEKSITENDELITDTLAGIYLQQKNYDKALKAYKKLSLKYPEKSIYFAARIEEIEKLMNTNS
ncbi:MAG TPA: hypothetical protein VK872_09970 [Draconibacterium sp.]|nr:hypothetical protein [Draconibacterium sp.]